jgi:hypothetical protein
MTLHYLNFKLLLLFFLAFSAITNDQDKKIVIISNIENAHVTIDSVYIGIAPIESYMTDKDTIRISMSDNNFDIWENERKTFDVAITKDTVIEVMFRKKINISTEPTEAELYLDSVFIGLSPLQIYLHQDSDNNLEIKKTYYKSRIVNLNESEINSLHFDLEIINKEIFDFKSNEEKFNSKQITYLIVGGLVAGLVSGFTKMEADAIEKEYKKSLDVSLKNSIKTYDTVSNISLAIFGSCFFYVNYLLLRD